MMPDLNCDLFKIAEIQCDVSLQYAFVRVKHVVHMYLFELSCYSAFLPLKPLNNVNE